MKAQATEEKKKPKSALPDTPMTTSEIRIINKLLGSSMNSSKGGAGANGNKNGSNGQEKDEI